MTCCVTRCPIDEELIDAFLADAEDETVAYVVRRGGLDLGRLQESDILLKV